MENEKRRLIVSDLDGTLLNEKGELSENTVKIVKDIIAQGHIFCISTGRPYRSAIKFYNQLGLNTIMSNINGGYIDNPSNPFFYSINNVFSKEILFNLLKTSVIRKKMLLIYVENQKGGLVFTKNKQEEIYQDMVDLFHVNAQDIVKIDINKKNEWKYVKDDIYSILINVDINDLDDVSFAIKSQTTTLFVDYWSNPLNSDIVTLDIRSVFQNKGSALEFISCYYGIPLRNTYTFGDGRNDIDMMKLTTRSFAMKNALYPTKMASYKITSHSNGEDGVARELKKAFLDEKKS